MRVCLYTHICICKYVKEKKLTRDSFDIVITCRNLQLSHHVYIHIHIHTYKCVCIYIHTHVCICMYVKEKKLTRDSFVIVITSRHFQLFHLRIKECGVTYEEWFEHAFRDHDNFFLRKRGGQPNCSQKSCLDTSNCVGVLKNK